MAKICAHITQRMAVILGTRGPTIKAYVHRDRKGSNTMQINGGSSLTIFFGTTYLSHLEGPRLGLIVSLHLKM
jgi:hypothetical protein